jgi:hypothetical protein
MAIAALPMSNSRRQLMADNLKSSGGQDRERINVNQAHELRDWAKKFDVTPDALKEAVQAVGDRADEVERHLRKRMSDRAAAGPHVDQAGSGNTMGDGSFSSRSGERPSKQPPER